MVVVQSQENSKVMDAKVLRQSYSTIRTRPREKRGVCVCACAYVCVCARGWVCTQIYMKVLSMTL